MDFAFKDVEHFHRVGGFAIGDYTQPAIPADQDLVALRLRLVDEEIKELHDAHDAGDIVEVADAIADACYVLVGMAVSYGINLVAVWDEVQRSNMAKVQPGTWRI